VPHLGGVAGGAVHFRERRRLVARGPAGVASNAPPYWLECLARHAEATLGERLKAHRVAAGLTMGPWQSGPGYRPTASSRRAAARSRSGGPCELIAVLGVGLVDVE
jgi:hypothetical protein